MEHIIIYDKSGDPMPDPAGEIARATDITFETMAPKGYAAASFKVRRPDVFADWIIQESFGVKIFDDATLIYQGRIETIPKNIGGVDEFVTVTATGWWVAFEERQIRKRWVDVRGVSFLRWPDGLERSVKQSSWVNAIKDNIVQVFAGTGDITRVAHSDRFRLLYETPAGYIRRVTFDYVGRTGEVLFLIVWNSSVGDPETAGLAGRESLLTFSGDGGGSGVNWATNIFLGDTRKIELIWEPGSEEETYDQNDFLHLSNLRVDVLYEAGHRAIADPTYTVGQLVEDVVLLVNQKGAQISTDFDQLLDPSLIRTPYAVEKPQFAAQVIEDLASTGDASLRSWLAYVWGDEDTSDHLPRFVFAPRDLSDYEYLVELNDRELAAFTHERMSTKLQNSVTVGWINSKNLTEYLTLSDTTSIDVEYERDWFIDIGEGDATRALYVAQRFLEYHKNRQVRGSLSQKDFIKTKSGGIKPVNQVHAGERFKLVNTGETFFIRHTNYTAETKTIQISPDEPEDNLAMLEAQRQRGLGVLVNARQLRR